MNSGVLRVALAFAVIALIAALFGFGLVADLAFGVAKILFIVFLILTVLALILGYSRGAAE